MMLSPRKGKKRFKSDKKVINSGLITVYEYKVMAKQILCSFKKWQNDATNIGPGGMSCT